MNFLRVFQLLAMAVGLCLVSACGDKQKPQQTKEAEPDFKSTKGPMPPAPLKLPKKDVAPDGAVP
jgi:hypothetical protein